MGPVLLFLFLLSPLLVLSSACGPKARPARPTAAVPPPPGAKPACPPAPPLRVIMAASTRLNPGESSEALAVVVRVYQLKGIGKLTGVSFDDLLDHDKEALGEDFLGVQEVTINPGERLEPRVVRNADAGYLLAVALFRRPAGTTWKVVRKLAPTDAEYCRTDAKSDATVGLYLDENRIESR